VQKSGLKGAGLKLIIDTNVIFSALLGNKKAQNLIFFEELIAPKMMFLEIFKHKEKIKKFSKTNIDILFFELAKNIKIVDEDYIPFKFKKQAYELCKDVDIKDTPFVALSLYLNVPLITGDKKLITELKKKNFSNILELKDI